MQTEDRIDDETMLNEATEALEKALADPMVPMSRIYGIISVVESYTKQPPDQTKEEYLKYFQDRYGFSYYDDNLIPYYDGGYGLDWENHDVYDCEECFPDAQPY